MFYWKLIKTWKSWNNFRICLCSWVCLEGQFLKPDCRYRPTFSKNCPNLILLTIVKSSSGCSWRLFWTVIFGIDKNSFNICALIGTFPEVSDHRIEPCHTLLVHRDHSLIQRWVIFVQIFNNAFFDLSLSKVLYIYILITY